MDYKGMTTDQLKAGKMYYIGLWSYYKKNGAPEELIENADRRITEICNELHDRQEY